jgi:hypothetical protein
MNASFDANLIKSINPDELIRISRGQFKAGQSSVKRAGAMLAPAPAPAAINARVVSVWFIIPNPWDSRRLAGPPPEAQTAYANTRSVKSL